MTGKMSTYDLRVKDSPSTDVISQTGKSIMIMSKSESIKYDMAVIGRGMAGMASALFAANRGLSTVQVGLTGGLLFASGFLDLMGIHPMHEKRSWQDPWAGIDALVRDIPNHPYARLKKEAIRTAFEETLSFLEAEGLPYCRDEALNSEMITPLGTVKQTYCIPRSMWNGVIALKEKSPCLIVDFSGLNDFNAYQIVATLKDRWPNLRPARVSFPGTDHVKEYYTGEILAQSMELSNNRKKLIKELQPHIKDAQAVGVPAVLGMNRTQDIVADLEKDLGVRVFEIPTPPVSVPGLRLNDTFTRHLTEKGVRHFLQNRVLHVSQESSKNFALKIGSDSKESTIRAKGIILASGRFWGRGLSADRKQIHETIFHLPVHQPNSRKEWHRTDFLDARGHPANSAGIEIDDAFRPLDRSGRPAFHNLFAAGSILAHQDWMRMKCGSGLAIATAYGAVESFIRCAV